MKQVFLTKFLIFSIILYLAFFIVGCDKETSQIGQDNINDNGVSAKGLVSSCGDHLKADNILGLLEDLEDVNNHRINLILYHYAQALRVVSQQPDLLCYLETAMIEDSEGRGVSLVKLSELNGAFSQSLNIALKSSVSANNIYPKGVEANIESYLSDPNWNANSYLTGKLKYGNDEYNPIVYFTKPPIECQTKKTAAIFIAQEVDECDDIPGWLNNEETLISEDQVNASTEPIIIVGPGLIINRVSPLIKNVETIVTNEPQGSSDRSDVDIDVDQHKIKAGYRYETNSRSEISGMVVAYSLTNVSIAGCMIEYWKDFKKSERKIHKDDIAISKNFTDDFDAFTIPANILDPQVSVVYTATYEHDWYASLKDIPFSTVCNPPTNINTFTARRKYEHEYYFSVCDYGSVSFTPMGTSRLIENDKCRFVLKSTN